MRNWMKISGYHLKQASRSHKNTAFSARHFQICLAWGAHSHSWPSFSRNLANTNRRGMRSSVDTNKLKTRKHNLASNIRQLKKICYKVKKASFTIICLIRVCEFKIYKQLKCDDVAPQEVQSFLHFLHVAVTTSWSDRLWVKFCLFFYKENMLILTMQICAIGLALKN